MSTAWPKDGTYTHSDGTRPAKARCVWCEQRIYRTRLGWLHAAIPLRRARWCGGL